MKRIFSVMTLVSFCLCCCGLLSAKERYEAKMMTRGGPNTAPVLRIQIVIESYTTGEEGWQLMQLLNQGGYEPFIKAFRQANKGSLLFMSARGLKVMIHVAHVSPKENGRKIMLFTERQSWEVDVFQRTSGRYPFMVIELDVDNKGNGKGRIYENAQIKFRSNPAGGTVTMEMEEYGSAPKDIFRVRLIK
jgi:hypothetical protein